jgi:hypothetical protein
MSTGNLLAKARLLAEQITRETDISVTVVVEKYFAKLIYFFN